MLQGQGIVQQGYIQADLSRVWLVLEGDSESDLRRTIEGLPLHPYITHVDVAAIAGPL
jgi:hypothetical protein